MSVTIGRVGRDGITIPDPEISYSGNQVTLSGQYTPEPGSATATADTLWLRDQLLGLADNDGEPIVPVRSTTVPTLDGFYRVVDAQASHPTGSMKETEPYLSWSATLDRLKDFREPRIEIYGVYGTVTNSFGITLPTAVTAVPQLVEDWLAGIRQAVGRRDTPDGQVFYATDPTLPSKSYIGRYSVRPAYYYLGGCKAEYQVSSGQWRTVIGRRRFTNEDIGFGTALLRADNGLVRITPRGLQFTVEWWDQAAGAWTTPISFVMWEKVSNLQVFMQAGGVLRSAPEELTIRMGAIRLNAPEYGPLTIDLRLRRGSRWVYGALTSAYTSNQFELRFPNVTAATNLTGAIRRTSNNTEGHREIIASAPTHTVDLTTGRLAQTGTTNTSWLFGFGVELHGSSATGDDTANSQKLEWFAAQSETQRVVAV